MNVDALQREDLIQALLARSALPHKVRTGAKLDVFLRKNLLDVLLLLLCEPLLRVHDKSFQFDFWVKVDARFSKRGMGYL